MGCGSSQTILDLKNNEKENEIKLNEGTKVKNEARPSSSPQIDFKNEKIITESNHLTKSNVEKINRKSVKDENLKVKIFLKINELFSEYPEMKQKLKIQYKSKLFLKKNYSSNCSLVSSRRIRFIKKEPFINWSENWDFINKIQSLINQSSTRKNFSKIFKNQYNFDQIELFENFLFKFMMLCFKTKKEIEYKIENDKINLIIIVSINSISFFNLRCFYQNNKDYLENPNTTFICLIKEIVYDDKGKLIEDKIKEIESKIQDFDLKEKFRFYYIHFENMSKIKEIFDLDNIKNNHSIMIDKSGIVRYTGSLLRLTNVEMKNLMNEGFFNSDYYKNNKKELKRLHKSFKFHDNLIYRISISKYEIWDFDDLSVEMAYRPLSINLTSKRRKDEKNLQKIRKNFTNQEISNVFRNISISELIERFQAELYMISRIKEVNFPKKNYSFYIKSKSIHIGFKNGKSFSSKNQKLEVYLNLDKNYENFFIQINNYNQSLMEQFHQKISEIKILPFQNLVFKKPPFQIKEKNIIIWLSNINLSYIHTSRDFIESFRKFHPFYYKNKEKINLIFLYSGDYFDDGDDIIRALETNEGINKSQFCKNSTTVLGGILYDQLMMITSNKLNDYIYFFINLNGDVIYQGKLDDLNIEESITGFINSNKISVKKESFFAKKEEIMDLKQRLKIIRKNFDKFYDEFNYPLILFSYKKRKNFETKEETYHSPELRIMFKSKYKSITHKNPELEKLHKIYSKYYQELSLYVFDTLDLKIFNKVRLKCTECDVILNTKNIIVLNRLKNSEIRLICVQCESKNEYDQVIFIKSNDKLNILQSEVIKEYYDLAYDDFDVLHLNCFLCDLNIDQAMFINTISLNRDLIDANYIYYCIKCFNKIFETNGLTDQEEWKLSSLNLNRDVYIFKKILIKD